jgi:Iron-sulfur cluster assembly protein
VSGSAGGPAPEAGRGPLNLMSALEGRASPEMLRELLREVIDPEIGINIVDLGLVYDVRWDPPWDSDEMMSDWAKDQLGWRR